jgi:hypothetical protein
MLLALLVAAAQPMERPKEYMERVYAGYRQPDFNPLAHPSRYFAPRLVAAMNEDARLAKGEVGYLDGDPVCQCQDPQGMHARIARVTRQTTSKALVEVIVDFVDSTARRVRFSLLRTAVGWRIADVSVSDEPSLLRALEESNRKARRTH